MKQISYNKPFIIGNELKYIEQAVNSGKISGDGIFTKKCHSFFEERYGFKKVFLTTSCTDALEMTAILCDIKPDDEVIIPSFTFVSSANAFALRGAKIVFADCRKDIPNIDENKIEALITEKTKAIIVVHYAGIACDMDKIMSIAKKHNLFVIEDAAHSIDSFYKGKPLGSIGDFGTFSFHETKNIICGEGGMLAVNNEKFIKRAEIIREKGTNRSAFFRGEIDKYGWVDIGSSFLPSDILAAFLYAQLENLEKIQEKRVSIWNEYYKKLKPLENQGKISLPFIPDYATVNGHIFYFTTKTVKQRNELLKEMNQKGINAIFHYLPLHKSKYFENNYNKIYNMKNTVKFSNTIIRLPLFFSMKYSDVKHIQNELSCLFGGLVS